MPHRILIVDDHRIMIDGIMSLLKNEKRFTVCGTAHDGTDALKEIEKIKPDILLADISMPGMDGITLTREVRKSYPTIKVIILTMYNDKGIAREILDAGAHGFILKNCGKDELLSALEEVMSGRNYYVPEVMDNMIDALKQPGTNKNSNKKESAITPREIEILKLIAAEYTSCEIADKLYLSERTVETHRKNLLRKTNSKNIVGLIRYAYEQKIIN
ncbi:MAG: response regulator transcription factor [Bacteroidetes bacterium]|nr:response regulator transcription factor [Bacteroidota bacterium]